MGNRITKSSFWGIFASIDTAPLITVLQQFAYWESFTEMHVQKIAQFTKEEASITEKESWLQWWIQRRGLGGLPHPPPLSFRLN